MGRARPRTEERYNRGRGKFYNYGNCAKVEVKMRKGKGYGSGYRKGMGRGIDCGRLGDKCSLRLEREG